MSGKRAIICGLICGWAIWIPLQMSMAQEASGGFTFKRVAPPPSGTKKRITVTIDRTWPYDYDSPERKSSPAVLEIPEPVKPSGFEWFWSAISPKLTAANPTRLDVALRAMNAVSEQERAALKPDLATMEQIIQRYGAQILAATAGKRVSPALVLAVIVVESSGRPDAESPKGAQGLMQLIPTTAERFGVKDSSDPLQNISGGAAYLDWLLGQFKGDAVLSLAGYNAGENAVVSNDGVPPYEETRAYVPKVVAAWEKARLYCQTLPVHADDGCVFAFDRSFIK